MTGLIVMQVGCPTRDVANEIGEALLRSGLTRVFHLRSVDSTYAWKGEITRRTETVLDARMPSAAFEDASGIVTGLHPYDVPSIIAIEIASATVPYGSWLRGDDDRMQTQEGKVPGPSAAGHARED